MVISLIHNKNPIEISQKQLKPQHAPNHQDRDPMHIMHNSVRIPDKNIKFNPNELIWDIKVHRFNNIPRSSDIEMQIIYQYDHGIESLESE